MSPLAEPARRFAALGDPARLRLVIRLAEGGARSIASLSVDSGMTRQGVAKHLRVLEEAGLISGQREGREMRFALERGGLDQAGNWLTAVGAQWEDQLGRLTAFVEAE